jgi:hypothetical protein
MPCGTGTSRTARCTTARAGRLCSAMRTMKLVDGTTMSGPAGCTPRTLPAVLQRLQDHLAGASPLYVRRSTAWPARTAAGNGCSTGARWSAATQAGAPQRMIGTLSDITGRKHTAEVLQASLRDKEALLKEVHHRVKNNLQVITSLLRLESRRTEQARRPATVLSDMQGRIGSMAQLHESLYQLRHLSRRWTWRSTCSRSCARPLVRLDGAGRIGAAAPASWHRCRSAWTRRCPAD